MSKENILSCPPRHFLFSTNRKSIDGRMAFLVDNEIANLFHQGAVFPVGEVFLAFDPKTNPVGAKWAINLELIRK